MQYEVLFKWGEIDLVTGDDFGDAMENSGWGDTLASEISRVKEVDPVSGSYRFQEQELLPF